MNPRFPQSIVNTRHEARRPVTDHDTCTPSFSGGQSLLMNTDPPSLQKRNPQCSRPRKFLALNEPMKKCSAKNTRFHFRFFHISMLPSRVNRGTQCCGFCHIYVSPGAATHSQSDLTDGARRHLIDPATGGRCLKMMISQNHNGQSVIFKSDRKVGSPSY